MRVTVLAATAAPVALATAVAFAQTAPTPGPNRPLPEPSPLSQPRADMVIHPTVEECRSGWDPRLEWTREQFESYCAQIKAAK